MAESDVSVDDGGFRVTTWTIASGDAIPMHRHDHDYVVVPLCEATMHVIGADGSVTIAELKPGTAYRREAGTEHRVENRGSDVIVFTEVERTR